MEGVWDPKFCGAKMAQQDFPVVNFVFSHDGHFGVGGGGRGGQGGGTLLLRLSMGLIHAW